MADANPVTVIPAAPVAPAVTEAIRAGIAGSTAVAVTYVDAQDRRTERVIEPHRLVTVDGVGYVECFCRRAGDYRTLRLDRIEVAAGTDSPVTAKPRAASGFSLEPAYSATVRVGRAGRWAFEDLPGARLTPDADGIVATFGVANPDVVVARLLAVAPDLRSVEPESLRASLADAARAVLAAG